MRHSPTSLLASLFRGAVICLICLSPYSSTAQLIQVALSNALADIDNRLTGTAYPDWDSIGSPGFINIANVLEGETTNAIPRALLSGAVATTCYWSNDYSGSTISSTAYLVVNCSGLLDANYIGGQPRIASTNVNELDLSGLPDITDTNAFYSDRASQGPYQSISELGVSNSGVINPVSNLFIYSYDPDRDQYFINSAELGQTNITLFKKFNINSITNFAAYTVGSPADLSRYSGDASFISAYFLPLRELMKDAGLTHKPDDITWNIINWLDPDRIPQTGDTEPWNHSGGGEAIPLINEVILTGSDPYTFTIELWFPFIGGTDTPITNGQFSLDVSVNGGAKQNFSIGAMEYGTATEFRTYDTATFAGLPATISVWVKENSYGVYVDHAMDRDFNPPFTFTSPSAYSVDDPRANGKPSYWTQQTATPGAMNVNSWPWMTQRQGLPIICGDRLMDKVGELGYIFLGNRENCDGGAYCGLRGYLCTPSTTTHPDQDYWTTINLYKEDEGVYLLDHVTTRDPNAPPEMRGLININSQQPEVLRTLFKNMKVGPSGGEYTLQNAAIDNLVATIIADTSANGAYISFWDMFTSAWDGGPVGQAFRACAAGASAVSDTHYEDVLRNIVEMVTFRQNLFTIILAVRVDDWSEERAVATVFRDSYTGTFITNSLNWLSGRIYGVPVGWLDTHYPNTNDLYSATWSDTDGDGALAWQEYIAGTSPTNSQDTFKITDISQITTNNLVAWSTVAGKYYRVQTTTNLMSTWTNVADPLYTNILGSGAPLSYTNTDSTDQHRFFRIKVR